MSGFAEIFPLTPKDWQRLAEMRQGFLEGKPAPYWKDERDLELYDQFFARRIEWKLEGALRQISATGWQPTACCLLDWGTGSGRISLRLAEQFSFGRIFLHDRSPWALRFAAEAHRARGRIAQVIAGFPKEHEWNDVCLLVSHVIGELTQAELDELLRIAARAREILWLEPGDKITSMRLSHVREFFVSRGWRMIAPCTHANSCPVLQSENPPGWCHFFAQPPSWIFQSAEWREAGIRLGFDLRSLPFSYIVVSRESPRDQQSKPTAAASLRSIGVPRMQKGFAEILACGEDGFRTVRFLKRRNPQTFRLLAKNRESFVWDGESPPPVAKRGGKE